MASRCRGQEYLENYYPMAFSMTAVKNGFGPSEFEILAAFLRLE
jgi:hypothetical protein